MSFTASRDAISALMGPAVRTAQAGEQIMSPRQRQLKSMRRASVDGSGSIHIATQTETTGIDELSARLASLDPSHPQDLFALQQANERLEHLQRLHMQQVVQLNARTMHSAERKQRGRGRPTYPRAASISIMTSTTTSGSTSPPFSSGTPSGSRRVSRTNSAATLAPVIEVASPSEEKPSSALFSNFSRPNVPGPSLARTASPASDVSTRSSWSLNSSLGDN